MKPGDRVRYRGWRGDDGTGTVVGFVRGSGTGETLLTRMPEDWGQRRDRVRIQRDFDAGGPTDFRPFGEDGEGVELIEALPSVPS